ncbi:hypothetical protein ACHAXR_008855 [Thalassiosira sp. AJA248-18]
MARGTSKGKAAKTSATKAKKQQAKQKMMDAPNSFVGRRISKKFSGDVYSGSVSKFVTKHSLWGIKYDDGDAEEMDWNDLSAAMELYDGSQQNNKTEKKGSVREATPSPEQDEKPADDSVTAADDDVAVAKQKKSSAKRATNVNDVPVVAAPRCKNIRLAVKKIVVDIPKKEAKEKRDLEAVKASEPPPKANSTKLLDPSQRKFGKTTQPISVDASLFERNPCRITGGITHHPSAYPNYHKGKGSFGFLIQRLSDRNYAMRALCSDGYGAEYNTYKKEKVDYISVVWYPPSNLNDHAANATIVDGCHLDLIDPNDGKTYLTGPNINSAIVNASEPVECVFLNGAQSNAGSSLSADDIASAIRKCSDSLLCLSLTECKLNTAVIDGLSSCSKLRGLILENCQLFGDGDDRPTDAKLAAVLRSCPDLQWCFVKSSIFGNQCWNVLATDACPNLEVLWVDAPLHTDDRVETIRGDHNIIRLALNRRSDKIKLCMINPDEKNESRYVIGGAKKTDRLNGRARTKEEKKVNLHHHRGGPYLNTV